MNTSTTPVVSNKDTKSTILDAYNQLLNEVRTIKKVSRKEQVIADKRQEIVKQAENTPPNEVIKSIADLKINISEHLDGIGEKFVTEYKKLTNIQRAIIVEEEKLKSRHEITANADTLEALLLSQERKREEFEQTMQEKKRVLDEEINTTRAQWQKEHEVHLLEHKEEEAALKKLRQREEDEYQYKLKMQRQKDRDQYVLEKETQTRELEEERANWEREMADREAAIVANEKEFRELKQKVAGFPEELAHAINTAREEAVKALKQEYQFKTALQNKEIEGERSLHAQTVNALESKINEQQARIKQLVEHNNLANNQVQTIAVKAIEGAANTRFVTPTPPSRREKVEEIAVTN